jgi:hypothetical protein
MTSFPAIPPDVEYDVSFTVSDKGGSGLDGWELQYRPFGTSSWTTLESGTSGGLNTHHHVSAEDNDDQFRVVVADRHGNRGISPVRLVSVPIDNTSASLVYTATWTHGAGDPRDFRDTLSTSVDVCCTVPPSRLRSRDATSPGSRTAARRTTSHPSFTEGVPGKTVLLQLFNGRRKIVFEHTFASVGTRTLTIHAQSGAVPIDGISVR